MTKTDVRNKMKTILTVFICVCAVQANATQIPFKNLTNLVAAADHVVIGTVTRVTMVNAEGQQVTDETARTGPGIENQLRLHVVVAKDGILATDANRVPDKLTIPLWQKWHDTLGNCRMEREGKTFIFLLKGTEFAPVYEGLFMRAASERLIIEELLKNRKPLLPPAPRH